MPLLNRSQPPNQFRRKDDKWLRRWRLGIIVGLILDLGISGVLFYQQYQINQNTKKNDCWSSVLDYAVLHAGKNYPHYRPTIINKARECREIT